MKSTNRMQKLGGVAALIEAGAYAFGIAVGFSALAAFMTGELDAAGTVAFIADNHALLYLWNAVIFVLFGVVLVVLVLALHERLADGAPSLARAGSAFGLIWAGLVLASGMIFNVGTSAVIDLHASDPAAAAAVWPAIAAVQDGLGGGNELVGGLWTLLVSWAALRTRALPRALNGLGVIVGVAGIVTLAPGLASFGIVFGLGQLLWFAWVGTVLLRGRAPAAAPRPVVARDAA